jgi:uncharacterized protein (TIGR04255 family)
MTFAPIFPAHAIERCTATVAFAPPLPDKAFLSVANRSADALKQAGFSAQQSMVLGFMVGADGSMTPQTPMAPPRVFQSPTGTLAVTLSAQGIVLTTGGYVRWQPFIGEFERLVLPILTMCRQIVSVSAVRLEYWDRFLWSGDWSTFRSEQLIRNSTPYITPAALAKAEQWHSHTGWFDRISSNVRRLVNVNIDVSDAQRDPLIPGQPSIGIYSSLTDQSNVPGFAPTPDADLDEAYVVEHLELQHLELKQILGHIIVDDMATQISLNPKSKLK